MGTWKSNACQTVVVLTIGALVLGCSSSRGPAKPQNLVLRTPDGLRLMATLWKPKGGKQHPAVLLIANPEQDRGAFGPLGERLAAAGIVALAVDMRIQGESLRANEFLDPLSTESLRHLRDDVQYLLDYLRRADYVDPERVGAVACAESADLVLQSLTTSPCLAAIALLSPVLSDSVLEELRTRPRPLFAVASYNDAAAAPIVQQLQQSSPHGSSYYRIYFAAGRGSDMLWGPEANDLIARLVSWFGTVLGVRRT
ncbi:MAG: hypothetical protein ONB23_12895 [candidate division KSB1 bacterium]|nr:hypothetical protein [candidate division KSB1 bacterium]